MPTATAAQPTLNRVVKGPHKGCIARVIGEQQETGHLRCQLRNLDKGTEVTDWMSPSALEELVKLEPGTMCRITGGDCEGFFAQVQEHDPAAELYVGSAYCVVITPKGRRRNGWVEDKYLRPCNQIKLKVGDAKAIASMTPDGMLLNIIEGDSILPYQTGKFLKSKSEAQDALGEYLESLEDRSRNSVVENKTEEGVFEELTEDDVEELAEEAIAQPIEESKSEEAAVALGSDTEPPKKNNVLQFPARSSVTEEVKDEHQATDKKTPPEAESELETPNRETEEEDWVYLSSEEEETCEKIASELIGLTEPYVTKVTDYLWKLKFEVFEDDHRRKSQMYGTFEQLCRHLHENCGFPYHPNTAREKANAEQERRLLRQTGVEVEVEKMSDAAALELRKIGALKAEPEVILEAKRKVVSSAAGLTRDAIASSIKSVAKEEDWENQYKFRYGKPKTRSKEKAEPISRQELEETQDRNTRLRRENEELRSQLQSTQEELGELRTQFKEKEENEVFLSGMLKTAQEQLDEKDQEIAQLKRELEEARRRSQFAS